MEAASTGEKRPRENNEPASYPRIVTECLERAGFSELTPIQSKCLGPLLQGRSVIGVSPTGSGKSLAFLLPALNHAVQRKAALSEKSCRVLVLAPTRELAQQLEAMTKKYCLSSRAGVTTRVAIGGHAKEERFEAVDLLFATPGRCTDLLQNSELSLKSMRLLLVDEIDRLVDMGFRPQLMKILQHVPDRDTIQTGLFSATLPDKLLAVIDGLDLARNSLRLSVEDSMASSKVTQFVEVTADHKRPTKLKKILKRIKDADEGERRKSSVLIFCGKIKTVVHVGGLLKDLGKKAQSFHGSIPQFQREKILSDFRAGKTQFLVATDVVSRGLDIKGVDFVINYDFPSRIETYIHRIGRCGRHGGRSGTAFSFFRRPLFPLVPDLIKFLEKEGQHVDPFLRRLGEMGENDPDFSKSKTKKQKKSHQ